MRFVCDLYQRQIDAGRLFLHEHPAYADSWEEKCVKDIMVAPGVGLVTADQCRYGAEVQFGRECGQPVKKPTGFLSNGG